MPITIGNGGNKTVTGITIGNGGNKAGIAVYVGDGGLTKLVWAAINLLGLDPVGLAPGPISYSLTNAGGEIATGHVSSTWLMAGAASDYEVRATLTSGSITGTFGSWLGLGTTRTWSKSGAASTASMDVEIRLAASGAVVAGPVGVLFTIDTP